MAGGQDYVGAEDWWRAALSVWGLVGSGAVGTMAGQAPQTYWEAHGAAQWGVPGPRVVTRRIGDPSLRAVSSPIGDPHPRAVTSPMGDPMRGGPHPREVSSFRG